MGNEVYQLRFSLRNFISYFLLILLVPGALRGDALPILADGDFSDWEGVSPLHADPLEDEGTSPIDFGRLWVANDDDQLFVRFETGSEIELQEDNNIVLYIDADNDPETGFSAGEVGAEMAWFFGARRGSVFNSNGSEIASGRWDDFGLRQSPTTSGSDFEVAFQRENPPIWPVFGSPTIAILLRNEESGVQDRLPDSGQTVTYAFDESPVPAPSQIPLGKNDSTHIRLISHNAERDSWWNSGQEPSFNRIYEAIEPDIFCFQEIYDHTAKQTELRVESLLGGDWHSAENADCIFVSRYPVLSSTPINGNVGALFDLPDEEYETDLYIINVHYPCCNNNDGRQNEVDNTIAHIRDLQTPGGLIDLEANTPIIVTGDMNFVGFVQNLETILTGDIQNEGNYGPDHSPDWNGTDLTDLKPRQNSRREVYTWENPNGSFPPGRLDFFFYTDSVVAPGNNYVLWTKDMPSDDLIAASLQLFDSTSAADHLPLVMDVEILTGPLPTPTPVPTPVPTATPEPTPTPAAVSNLWEARMREGFILIGGEVTVTVGTGELNAARNQLYIQDSSGLDGQTALLIDDPNFVLARNFERGDVLTGLEGSLTIFNGMLQFVPSKPVTVRNVAPVPDPLTVDNSLADFEMIEAEIVQLLNAEIAEGGTWIGSTNYQLLSPLDTVFNLIRIDGSSDVVGEPIPSGSFHVMGPAVQFSSNLEVLPRDMNDIVTVLEDGVVVY